MIIDSDMEKTPTNKLSIYLIKQEYSSPEDIFKDHEKQIDELVYKLYGLTPEEIAAVEGRQK